MFFPPYHCYRKLLPLLSPFYFQRGSQQTPFLFSRIIFYKILVSSSLIWLLLLLCFSLNVFQQSLEILRMHLINKNDPAKRDNLFILEKKLSTKRRSLFYESAILWENLFSYKQILIFQLNSFIRLELA